MRIFDPDIYPLKEWIICKLLNMCRLWLSVGWRFSRDNISLCARAYIGLPCWNKKKPSSREGFFYKFSEGLFTYNFKINFNIVSVAEVDSCFVSTEFFYFFHDADTLAVDLVTFLVADSACDLQ